MYPSMEVQILNHWTTRKSHQIPSLNTKTKGWHGWVRDQDNETQSVNGRTKPSPQVSPNAWFFTFVVACICACLVIQSCVTLCDPWTVACQMLLSIGLFKQEYCSGYHFLLQSIFPTQGLSLHLQCILFGRQILYPWTTWEALCYHILLLSPLYRKLKARCWQGWFSSKGSTREGFTFLPVWLLGSLQLPMIIELTASVFGGERPPSSIKGHPQFSVTQASKTWPTASSRLEREDLERVCWQGGISCNTTWPWKAYPTTCHTLLVKTKSQVPYTLKKRELVKG